MTDRTFASSRFKHHLRWTARAVPVLYLIAMGQVGLAGQARAFAPSVVQSCQLSIDQKVVDYGRFTAGQLSRAGQKTYALAPRWLRINVDCAVETAMGLRLTAASAADGSGAPRFATAGSVRVTMSDAYMDGAMVDMRVPGRSDVDPRSLDVRANDTVHFNAKNGKSSGTNLSVRVRIEPKVDDKDTHIVDQTEWVGQLDFELTTP